MYTSTNSSLDGCECIIYDNSCVHVQNGLELVRIRTGQQVAHTLCPRSIAAYSKQLSAVVFQLKIKKPKRVYFPSLLKEGRLHRLSLFPA